MKVGVLLYEDKVQEKVAKAYISLPTSIPNTFSCFFPASPPVLLNSETPFQ
jgi:hypothetical protein